VYQCTCRREAEGFQEAKPEENNEERNARCWYTDTAEKMDKMDVEGA